MKTIRNHSFSRYKKNTSLISKKNTKTKKKLGDVAITGGAVPDNNISNNIQSDNSVDFANKVINKGLDFSNNLVDKAKKSVISNIDEFLDTKQLRENGSNILRKINTPEFKAEFKETMDNIADYSDIALKAMDKPIDDALDKLNESSIKAASAAVSGAVKIGTDAMAAIPGVGAIIELGKIANDGSKAVSTIVESTKEASDTFSNFVNETRDNLQSRDNLQQDKLNLIKQQGGKILERTANSITEFHNNNVPIKSILIKKSNTKKKFKINKNKKTKRVRFNI
jgi:hypothetical protein